MVIDIIALLLVAGLTYLIMFAFTKAGDDPSTDVAHEEKLYDVNKGINKLNL